MTPKLLAVWLVLAPSVLAQPTATVRIHVQHDSKPVAGAEVVVNDSPYTTSTEGDVTATVTPGAVTITVVKEGFEPLTSAVQVESALGRGSCFTVTLPAVRVRPGHTATRSASAPGSHGHETPATDPAAPGSAAINIRPMHHGEGTHS